MNNWDERARRYGDRGVFNLNHIENLDLVTARQGDIIFPVFESLLTGTERLALDFGCGWGRWTTKIRDAINGLCIGVDPSAAYVSQAQRRYTDPFVCCHPPHLAFHDHVFDVIWSCNTLCAVTEDSELRDEVNELNRVLAPGGLVFLVETVCGHEIRNEWSVVRTVARYQQVFQPAVSLAVHRMYTDLNEMIAVMAGRAR